MLWQELLYSSDLSKGKIIMSSFFHSQFNYCVVIYMLHNRRLDKKNKLHEHCLQLVYNDEESWFGDLLDM